MRDPAFLARPTKAQFDWADMELGLFIHWFPMGWYHTIDEDRLTDPGYQKELCAKVTCEELDTDQWVQSAVDLGAKYIVFVAKHGMGFCRWQTDEGVFGMKQAPYKNGKGDPVAELAESCRKRGIKLGLYAAGDSKCLGVGIAGRASDPEKEAAYAKTYRTWLTELLSKYGDVVEVWFDGSLVIDIGDVLKEYAPNAMVFQSKYATIRWVGQEQGYASDPAYNTVSRYDAISGIATQRHSDPDGDAWMPIEVDARLRKDWGYWDDLSGNPIHSLDELMNMYYRSVGHGATLLINQAPNAAGRIIDEDMERMKEFGDEIRRRFSSPLAEGSGQGGTVELRLGGETAVDHVILMEDILFGERVRGYAIEGLTSAGWQRLHTGSAIGRKKIDYFDEVVVSAIRFVSISAVGEPLIRRIAAFHVGEIPVNRENPSSGVHKVGEWGTELYDLATHKAEMRFNLAPFIEDAGQYRVSFEAVRTETPLIIDEAWLEIDGVRQEGYVTRADGEHNYNVYVPGVAKDIVFNAASAYDRTPQLTGYTYISRVS
jgi:alpha-L-fucosidase